MAIYHSRVKIFSRGKGHSSVAAAAYRAGLLLTDERTGKRHDYRRRGGVVESRCVVPEDAPDWSVIPAQLWGAAEQAERRKDATVAREFEIALPHELTDEQRAALAWELTSALVDRYRFAAQASIHSPDGKDGLNWHLHILVTTRRIDAQGLADKTRELDGGASGKVEVEWARAMVAQVTNAHLAAAELGVRVDHRRLPSQAAEALAQGDLAKALALSRQPTQHLGKDGAAMVRRGAHSDRADGNERIREENDATFEAMLNAIVYQDQDQDQDVPEDPDDQIVRRKRRNAAGGDGPVVAGGGGLEVHGLRGWSGSHLMTLRIPPMSELASNDSLFAQARRLWLDEAVAAISGRLQATRALFEKGLEWLSRGLSEDRLRSMLRQLVKHLTALRRWASEWKRREGAERRAMGLLHRAERALKDFVETLPRPSEEGLADWARQRGRRLAAIVQRLAGLKKARDELTPQAEKDCLEQLGNSVTRLEALSQASVDVAGGLRQECDADSDPQESQPPLNGLPAKRPRLH
ncbi:MobA/MobL family protein [Stenotrophomonas indicatrix]|uniref:MobA/MobL family protein n=1 Tax=Stenotrophomonas indicatrix TaxID=2045451 RepID=UPI0028B054D4|nr:MobA/MobL family protein [Stenotrophomonas indicatrix]